MRLLRIEFLGVGSCGLQKKLTRSEEPTGVAIGGAFCREAIGNGVAAGGARHAHLMVSPEPCVTVLTCGHEEVHGRRSGGSSG